SSSVAADKIWQRVVRSYGRGRPIKCMHASRLVTWVLDYGLCTAATITPMSVRVSNVRLGVDEPEANLPTHLARILGLAPSELRRWRILRKSLDARHKDALRFVYTAEVAVPADEARVVARAARRAGPVRIERFDEERFVMPPPGREVLAHRPVV